MLEEYPPPDVPPLCEELYPPLLFMISFSLLINIKTTVGNKTICNHGGDDGRGGDQMYHDAQNDHDGVHENYCGTLAQTYRDYTKSQLNKPAADMPVSIHIHLVGNKVLVDKLVVS